MSNSELRVIALYEHKEKFIVKFRDSFCHLLKSDLTKGIELKKKYSISADSTESELNGKVTTILTLLQAPIQLDDNEIVGFEVDDYSEMKKTFLSDLHSVELFKSLKLLSTESPEREKDFAELLKNIPELNIRFSVDDDQNIDSKFLIHENERSSFMAESFIQRFDKTIKILRVGKRFTFKKIGNKKNKSKLKDGDPVCYVYYSDSFPNWTSMDFMLAMKSFMDCIETIKNNAVKPRHSLELVKKLKQFPVICDGRNRFMGHSWIVLGDEDLWYCSYLLSSASQENNIKINGKFAQCWRVSKRHVDHILTILYGVDALLFKSNALPVLPSDTNSIIIND